MPDFKNLSREEVSKLNPLIDSVDSAKTLANVRKQLNDLGMLGKEHGSIDKNILKNICHLTSVALQFEAEQMKADQDSSES